MEMERPVRRIIFVLLALTATAHAQAVVFTFDQWARLSAGLQEIYVSGAIDAVFTIATPASAGTAKYYNDCGRPREVGKTGGGLISAWLRSRVVSRVPKGFYCR